MDMKKTMEIDEFLLKTKKLKLLLENGLLTKEQFEEMKMKLINDMEVTK